VNERFRFLFVGLYAWVAAVFLGGTLLDKVYANNLKGVLGSSERAMVFSEISDILLCIGFVLVIAGIGAIAVSWKSRIARNLFIASLVVLSFEILIPVFSALFKNTQELSWMRLLPSGIASILAFIGMYTFYRQ
jgi:phosphoglycerol transferase MdoB-like AlkP superfamily enzyme